MTQNPTLTVQENLRIILSEVVGGVHKKVNEYLRLLREAYYDYLQTQTNRNTNFQGSNPTGISDKDFNQADSEYRNVEKTLKKIAKHIGNEFEYVAEIGKDVMFNYQKWLSVQNDIANAQQMPESIERDKKLRKLYKKFRKTFDKYNKSANEFNTCVLEFQALFTNLQNNIITIPSRTSNKTYSISLERINELFKHLTESEGLSQLREKIKSQLAANQPAPVPPSELTSLNLTPITVMTMPDVEM